MAETSETQEAGLTAHILFEDGSVEDKWAYEAHNHNVPAAVAEALFSCTLVDCSGY